MARKQQAITIDYQPQERQKLLHLSQARQILYGGAAGGGKSHAIRWDGIMFACQNPGFVGVLIRRSRAELIKNHIQQVMELPEVIGRYSHDRNCYEFFNGSKLYMEYCERDADLLRHQGAEYHWIGIDEAALVEEHHLHFLKSRLRLGGWKPANEADARRLPRFVMASNPGGPAHNYLKHTFMDHGIKPETYFYDKEMRNPRDPEDKGWVSIFIPARIADNKYIDAGYDAAFSGLPPEQQRAFRDGDWDAIVGKAIHNLDREKHLIRPFEPPRHWTHFMSIDWGSHRPYSIGWYTVSEGALLKGKDGYRDVWLPPGAVIRYKELYGWNGKANQGARTPAPEVAKRIIQKEAGGPIMDYRVADSEMWADRGQPSIVDWFRKVDDRLIFRKSKKDRKRNYAEMIARLSGNADYMKDGQDADYPMFYVTQNCQHFWRTVPNLILDSNDPEKGPDTLKQEDHCITGDTEVWVRGPENYECTMPIGELGAFHWTFPGQILTSEGWSDFVWLGETGNCEIWSVEFEDGLCVEATASHPFLTHGGYKRVDELTEGEEILRSWTPNESRSSSKAGIITSAGPIINGRASASTGWSGKAITGRSRKGIMFTTLMGMLGTTISRIWSYCRPLTICPFTPMSLSVLNMPSGTWKPECSPRRLNGMGLKRDASGIPSKGKRTASFHKGLNILVLNAAKKVWQRLGLESNSAQPNVTSADFVVRIRAITRTNRKKPVYNVHVPGINNFVLENGAIVHNCYDECVYALRSRPFVTTELDAFTLEREEQMRGLNLTGGDPYATA